jgi:hypothetical protein
MTFCYSRPTRHATPFGLFHNRDYPDEDTGYLTIHIFTARFSLYWTR